MFNNAGVQLISPIEDVRFDGWLQLTNLNITGVMNVIGVFVPQLIGSAADDKSPTYHHLLDRGNPGTGEVRRQLQTKPYVSQLTRSLRGELGRKMVRVSMIEPRLVNTELPLHVTGPDATRLMAELIKDIDVLTAADVAETVSFIASVPATSTLTEITILPTQQAV